jgi:hypothetical protein
MRFDLRSGIGVCLACAAAGCGSNLETYGPPTNCPPGTNCIVVSGGGSGAGAGGADGGTDGGGTSTEVTGTVIKLISETFNDAAPVTYAGVATIVAPGPAGTVTAMYGGTGGTMFDLLGVDTGQVWFEVQDGTSGGSGILSTLSVVNLPAIGGVTLPVIDQGTLTTIASSLPSIATAGVSMQASQVILIIEHSNLPYKGIAVSGGAAGAALAYDTGGSAYSDTATATGTAGVAILFNSGLSGTSTLTLTDTTTQMSYQVAVQAAKGAATIVALSL